MKAARSQIIHVNWADPAIKGEGHNRCKNQIIKFITGIHGPRKNPVTKKQIMKWVPHTPSEFVDACIDSLIMDGSISIRQKSLSSGRRYNGAYVYEISDGR